MRHSALLFVFALVSVFANAQDTIYFNGGWQAVDKSKAKYFRIQQEENNLVRVADYFISGQQKMTGTYLASNPTIKHGRFRYFIEDGTLTQEGEYRDDKKYGLWKLYYGTGRVQHEWTYQLTPPVW